MKEIIRIVTGADNAYFTKVVAMIASLKKTIPNIGISLYDLGLKKEDRDFLSKVVTVRDVEIVNPYILEKHKKHKHHDYLVIGCYSWKPVCFKQEFEFAENVFWLDAGTTPLLPFKWIIEHTINTGFFALGINDIGWQTTQYVIDKLSLSNEFLDKQALCSAYVGCSQSHYDSFVMPMYEYSKDINMYYDDGTARGGLLSGRQDQTIFSIQAHLAELPIFPIWNNMHLITDEGIRIGNITMNRNIINESTSIYHSRGDAEFVENYEYLKSLCDGFGIL